MTDNSGTSGGSALPAGVRAWARQIAVGTAGVAVLATATVVAVVHTTDPASADTVVTSVRNAVLRTADGVEREAVVGQRVPPGGQIRTGTEGGAELTSSGRITYLGALTTVDVLDGVREKLDRGQVMVDSRTGVRLSLTTLAGSVTTAAGSLTRVETAAALRVAVFDGAVGFTATGRQATTAVAALHQVQVPYGYLPGQVTPLALTDDRWETRLASALVSADQDLTHLASSLAGRDGVALLDAAPASLRAGLGSDLGADLAPDDRAELALTAALAQAAAGSPSENLTEVKAARSGGGSWGVVAALVDARVTSVSKLLDAALMPLMATPPTLAAAPAVTSLPGLLEPTPVLAPSSSSPAPAPVTTTTRRPTKKPPTTPTATPTDPGLVGGLVTTVLDLLKPPAKASPAPVAPTPTPTKLLGLVPVVP